MSVFFPHLSKAEHVRQTKKYPGNPCFPRFPAPCEAEHRRQPGRPYFGTFDHTGADSVSRLHLSKGRRHSPDVFCCPELGMVVAAVPRIYMGDARKRYSSHSPLLPSGKQLLRFHIAKRGKKNLQSSFFPRFLLFRPPPSRTWRICQVSHCLPSRSTFPADEKDFSLRSQ